MLERSFRECLTWYAAQETPDSPAAVVCPTRDVFQGRLDHLHQALTAKFPNETDTALLAAVTGEIGNNCFDHNLGQWRDVPGCWLQYEMKTSPIWALVADRGQGVLSSLQRVLPSLATDSQALETAFNKKLSGRSPERRGNGLKFVRSILNGKPNRGLLFISGSASVAFGGLAHPLHALQQKAKWDMGRGTVACLLWHLAL